MCILFITSFQDNPIGTGTGVYKSIQLFEARNKHASLVPAIGLVKAEDVFVGKTFPSQHAQPENEKWDCFVRSQADILSKFDRNKADDGRKADSLRCGDTHSMSDDSRMVGHFPMDAAVAKESCERLRVFDVENYDDTIKYENSTGCRWPTNQPINSASNEKRISPGYEPLTAYSKHGKCVLACHVYVVLTCL